MAEELASQNAQWYHVDFNKLMILMLPILWRRKASIGFLQSLIRPLVGLHYSFVQNRKRNIYRVNHNYQICYLEKALNDEFDPSERRIRIEEDFIAEYNYIYTFAENKPKHLGRLDLYDSSAYESNIDFKVNMNGAGADRHDIEALVDFYKLFGTRYIIINNAFFEYNEL